MSTTTHDWSGTDVSVREIDSGLARLRRDFVGEGELPHQRTSVMTHLAWVPPKWLDAAERTLSGMAERHPSRTVLLVPYPDAESQIDAVLSVHCFAAGDTSICSEVIELALGGERTRAPASIVLPLLISDLPVFLRWRGEPPFDQTQWEQLTGVADRLVVDSSEWEELRYHELSEAFDRIAVSDIAWARTAPWRTALAECWPPIAKQEILISGPRAEAALLRGWLQARLDLELPPAKKAAKIGVRLDGELLAAPHDHVTPSPSDLLSAELDRLGRDRIYEQAAISAG